MTMTLEEAEIQVKELEGAWDRCARVLSEATADLKMVRRELKKARVSISEMGAHMETMVPGDTYREEVAVRNALENLKVSLVRVVSQSLEENRICCCGHEVSTFYRLEDEGEELGICADCFLGAWIPSWTQAVIYVKKGEEK